MIEATIKVSGALVDKPRILQFQLQESTLAAETQLPNGKTKKWTVGELYDIYTNKNSYIKENIDPEDMINPTHFDLWFRTKYIKDKSFEQRIISITFKQTNN